MATAGPIPGSTEARESLIAAARAAAAAAHAPYSRLHVGAALLSAKGRIHAGCNVENAAYPLGACAEPAAIAAGVLAEGAGFRVAEVAVWAETDNGGQFAITPCGGCRQRLSEFATHPGVLVHFAWPGPEFRSVSIGELLPHAFGWTNRPRNRPGP